MARNAPASHAPVGIGAADALMAAFGLARAEVCCWTCTPNYPGMLVCSTCGNKRCPHATDHALACTNSNEPGQAGSIYGGIAPDPDRGPLPPGEPREDDGGEDSDGSDAPEWVGSDREGRG